MIQSQGLQDSSSYISEYLAFCHVKTQQENSMKTQPSLDPGSARDLGLGFKPPELSEINSYFFINHPVDGICGITDQID